MALNDRSQARRLAPIPLALGLVLLLSTPGNAQSTASTFGALPHRIREGDRVFVIDRHGREILGRVTRLTPTQLVVVNGADQRTFEPSEIGRIEKADPVWDGAVIGASLLVLPSMALGGVSCWSRDCTGALVRGAVIGVGLGGTLGALIDRAHGGRAALYSAERLHADPVTALADLWRKVKTGDQLTIVDDGGRRTVATFDEATDQSLVVIVGGRRQEYHEGDIRTITAQLGDGARSGFWAGAAVGASLVAFGSEGPAGERAVGAFMGGMIYGAIGAGLGTLHRPHSSVYLAPGRGPEPTVLIAPLVSPTRRGVLVSVGF